MSDNYIINDLDNLAASIRKNAALSFSEDYTENLDDFISLDQVKTIIVSNTITTDNDELLLDEESYNDIFDEIRTWIYNVGLAKLASNDQVECAWDDESNEMIFWMSDSKANRKSGKNARKKTR